MANEKGLLRLQRKLAVAEQIGDTMTMAKGYIVLADALLRVGDHRLGHVFIERAGECLAFADSSPVACD